MTQEPTDGKFRPTRRTVIAAAAWSVPVIMVAKAAPAFAGTTQFLQFTGQACKWPGDSEKGHTKAYSYGIKSTNVNQYTVLVVITNIDVVGQPKPIPPEYNIDPQWPDTDHNGIGYIPLGSPVGDFSQEGFAPCAGMSTPLQQNDGSNTYTTFAIAPGDTVFWSANMGQFGTSQQDQMAITYEVWRNATPGNIPFSCTGAVLLQPTTTTKSGIHTTEPCATSSSNFWPSYSTEVCKDFKTLPDGSWDASCPP